MYFGKVDCDRGAWIWLLGIVRYFVSYFVFFASCIFILTMNGEHPNDYITLAIKFGVLTILIRMDEIVIGEYFDRLGEMEEFEDIKWPSESEAVVSVGQ